MKSANTSTTSSESEKSPPKTASNANPVALEKQLRRSKLFFDPLPQTALRVVKPATIMASTERLTAALHSYFNVQIGPERPPTFEGLALAAGFHSFAQLREAIMNENHPQASRDQLIIACAHIADAYQQHGLLESMNPSFIKYLLSAYLNISEKHLNESSITEDKTITIRWDSGNAHDMSKDAQAAERTRIAATTTSKTALEDELRELEIDEIL